MFRTRVNGRTLLLVVGGVLLVAAHLGLGGAAFASPWTGWAAMAIPALILLKIALPLLGRRTLRHRWARRTHRQRPPSGG